MGGLGAVGIDSVWRGDDEVWLSVFDVGDQVFRENSLGPRPEVVAYLGFN